MLLGCLKTLQRPYQILDWYWALAFLWQNNNIAKCADGRDGKPHSKGSKFLVSKCLYCFSPDWLETAFCLLKFNPLKNRSIINSYIYSFLYFWKTYDFFCSSSKFPKIALNFKEYFWNYSISASQTFFVSNLFSWNQFSKKFKF